MSEMRQFRVAVNAKTLVVVLAADAAAAPSKLRPKSVETGNWVVLRRLPAPLLMCVRVFFS